MVTTVTLSLSEAPHEELVEGYEDGVQPFLDAGHEDLHGIDLTGRLRTETACPGVIGSTMVYRDFDHVTSAYGETLAPDVEQRMIDALGRA